MTHKEIAERLRKEIKAAEKMTKATLGGLRRIADELDPPKPEPGTVVWWRYKHNHAFGWQLGEAITAGVLAFGDEGVIIWGQIEWKPARILAPDEVRAELQENEDDY